MGFLSAILFKIKPTNGRITSKASGAGGDSISAEVALIYLHAELKEEHSSKKD